MKIQLEFEDGDFEKMIITYFEKEGFEVKNLEELCAKFKEAYPEGLRVQAGILPEKPVEEAAPYVPEEEEEEEDLSDVPEDNPRLGLSDLIDPTPSTYKGRREAVLQHEEAEVQNIQSLLHRSRSLKEKGPRNV